jgi:hypothetical protein
VRKAHKEPAVNFVLGLIFGGLLMLLLILAIVGTRNLK